MLVTLRAYHMAGLGQADPKPAAPAQPEGISTKSLVGMALLGAALGAVWHSTRFAGTPEPKDLAPAAGVGGLVGLGLAATWRVLTGRASSFATAAATKAPPVTT